MPFNQKPQKFSAKINTVTIGTGDKAISLGGESVLPFYTFDGDIENAPKVGVEITDNGIDDSLPGIKAFYDGCASVADMAKKASQMEGADFVVLTLVGGDPNGDNKSVEDLVAIVKEVVAAVDCPLVVKGCSNVEKDAALLPKVAEACQGTNALIMSAKEENYKAVGASVGLAYDLNMGAESAVDINLAKQLNVISTQLGVKADRIAMDVGTAAVGYGYEYVVSAMDRIRGAALSQDDATLQMPIITPVANDSWNVKEAVASEEDFPEWGPREDRGIGMEIMTAASDLVSGSNAVILRHPQSVATIAKMIKELV